MPGPEIPKEIPRDRWDRPLIRTFDPVPDDPKEAARWKFDQEHGFWMRPYTRVSSLAGSIGDKTALEAWEKRHIAVGLATRPDLIDRINGLRSKYEDPVGDWPAKKDLNRIWKDAKDASHTSRSAANTGTALHELVEALEAGRPIFPGRWADHIQAYKLAMADYRILENETFIVNDQVGCAGTLDKLVQLLSGAVVVGDLKTGKSEADYPEKVATQIAIYARGQRYDPDTGLRAPLHDHLDVTTGLLIHLPVAGVGPVCAIHRLDLEAGWHRARLAAALRDENNRKADHYYKGDLA